MNLRDEISNIIKELVFYRHALHALELRHNDMLGDQLSTDELLDYGAKINECRDSLIEGLDFILRNTSLASDLPTTRALKASVIAGQSMEDIEHHFTRMVAEVDHFIDHQLPQPLNDEEVDFLLSLSDEEYFKLVEALPAASQRQAIELRDIKSYSKSEPIAEALALLSGKNQLLACFKLMLNFRREMEFSYQDLEPAWDKEVSFATIKTTLARIRRILPRQVWDLVIQDASYTAFWAKRPE